MALTAEEIKSIGRETGKKIVVKSKCKERVQFVLDEINQASEHQLETITLALPSVSFKKAKSEILFDVKSHIDTIKEFYPDMPIKSLLLHELENIKSQAEKADREEEKNVVITRAADGYRTIQEKLLDVMLEDFKQCECEDQRVGSSVKIPMAPGVWLDGVVLSRTPGGNYNVRLVDGREIQVEAGDLYGRDDISSAVAKKKLPTREDVIVTVMEERDRLHIGIVDKATEQISYADWWDDDARQMFEDGFFKAGIVHHQLSQEADRKMTDSILEYAEDMGILAK